MEITLKVTAEALSRPGVVNRTFCMKSLTRKIFCPLDKKFVFDLLR